MTRIRIITRTLTAAALLAAASCGTAVRTGSSSSFLVIDSLAGIRGAAIPSPPGSLLISDVITIVRTGPQCTAPINPNGCPFVFGDNGSATLELAKKDVTSVAAPTTNNEVTINRIHIHYHRPDGGGVAGVDVPFDFDTFSTATVPATGSTTIGFELVRVQAKAESPLFQLQGGGVLAVAADVTFFGQDRVGNNVSVTGSIQIEFSDWGDF
jgi:hypothetical protein